jgi:hypothetical protein
VEHRCVPEEVVGVGAPAFSEQEVEGFEEGVGGSFCIARHGEILSGGIEGGLGFARPPEGSEGTGAGASEGATPSWGRVSTSWQAIGLGKGLFGAPEGAEHAGGLDGRPAGEGVEVGVRLRDAAEHPEGPQGPVEVSGAQVSAAQEQEGLGVAVREGVAGGLAFDQAEGVAGSLGVVGGEVEAHSGQGQVGLDQGAVAGVRGFRVGAGYVSAGALEVVVGGEAGVGEGEAGEGAGGGAEAGGVGVGGE